MVWMTGRRRRKNTPLGREEINMNLKKIIAKKAMKEAAGKILPMDVTKPKLGKKTKLAAILGAIAAAAAAGANLLGG